MTNREWVNEKIDMFFDKLMDNSLKVSIGLIIADFVFIFLMIYVHYVFAFFSAISTFITFVFIDDAIEQWKDKEHKEVKNDRQ